MGNRYAIFFVAVLPLSAIPNVIADDGKHEIHGEWQVIAQEYKGEVDSGVSFRGMRYVFSKDSYRLVAGSTTPAGLARRPPLTGPFRVDDSKTPRHLDYTMRAGGSSQKIRAIYKIKDGKLYLCFGRDIRPDSFDTKGTSNLMYILERVPDPAHGENEAVPSREREGASD